LADRPRWLPRPFEILTLGAALIALGTLRARGIPLGWSSLQYMATALLGRLPGLIVLGLGLHLLVALVRRRSPLPWLRQLGEPASLALWLRLWLALLATTWTYSWLKVSIPLLRPVVHDGALWALDRALHLGISPSVLAAELVRGTPLAGPLDLWYALWLSSVLGLQSYVFLFGDAVRRRHFALACAALWLAGVAVYLLLPAVGPCFFRREAFAGILDEMPRAAAIQERLWGHYLQVVAARSGQPLQLRPFLAVAAFPSLHVGAHFLFALWAKRWLRALYVPFLVATGLTFLGSLATGWHYAVDGYAGMLLAWLAVRLADCFEPVEERPDGDQEPAEGGLDAGRDAALEPGAEAARSDRSGDRSPRGPHPGVRPRP